MKKALSFLLAAAMVLGLTACGGTATTGESTADSAAETSSEAATEEAAGEDTAAADGAAYVVGICQQMPHEALDSATQGFKDALVEAFGEDGVTFDEQNAQGDSNTCNTIVTALCPAGMT